MKLHRFLPFTALLLSPGLAQTNTYPFPSSGNIGIGTTSPQEKLHIGGSSSRLLFDSNTNIARILFYGDGSGTNDYGFGIDSSDLVSVFGTGGGMTFKTSSIGGSALMRITGGGKVGIGTIHPRSRLDIGSHIGAGKGASFGDYFEINERELFNNAVSLGWNAYIAADDGTYAPAWAGAGASGMVLAMDGGGVANLDFWGKQWTSGEPASLGSFTHVMRLSTNGSVGIGTTNPNYKLEVSAADTRNIYFDVSGSPKIGTTYGTGGSVELYNNATGAMTFTTSSTAYPFVFSTGNVGIGTTNPQHKLAVNGTIKAKEVIVETTGWSDYVFASDYRLAPLSEVEAHIAEKKHLPGMPSATEVSENGVNVAQVQAALLAKVEELTLHLIAQEKSLRDLKSENEALKTRMATYERR